MSVQEKLERDEINALCEEAMKDKAVTNISGWTEPNSDEPCDEEAYRMRLAEQGSTYMAKVKEALKFE